MLVKRSGKHIIGADLTAAEKKAMNMEIQKQMAEFNRRHSLEIEALVIRQVRRRLKHSIAKTREFYDWFVDDLMALSNHYEMGEEDQVWLALQELKAEGIDIEQWHRERWPNDRFD